VQACGGLLPGHTTTGCPEWETKNAAATACPECADRAESFPANANHIMPPINLPPTLIPVANISNREFLDRYARPGCVGLSGGVTLVDRAIRRAERHLDEQARWSEWSHAFIFQGVRADGHHWVIESDLQIQHKHIQLGVQENRVAKYHDEELYTALAVLDFGLNEEQAGVILREGLELVANRTRYSLRELVGTLLALRRPALRGEENLLARKSSVFCSALVQYLFRKTGLDLTPGVTDKHTTPEDLARTTVPHTTYLLQHEMASSSASVRHPAPMLKAEMQKMKPRVGRR
jgi:hypothetical protein